MTEMIETIEIECLLSMTLLPGRAGCGPCGGATEYLTGGRGGATGRVKIQPQRTKYNNAAWLGLVDGRARHVSALGLDER